MTGKKRKLLTTIALILSLLFGKPRLSPSRSSSPNFANQVVNERVIGERELNSLEENNQQVILAKSDGNPVTPPTNRGPSNFPTPPSGGRPSQPVYVPKYRIAPKIVNPGLGAAANPAGAGGGGGAAEFDDNKPSSKKNNHKNQKLLIMIIVQMIHKRNQRINVQLINQK